MRLIDADALKDRLQKHGIGTAFYYKVAIDTAVQILDETPTIGGWISVKDRLPEQSGSVLVARLPYQFLQVVDYSAKHRAFNSFDDYTHDESEKFRANEITHWMPLPKPPEEGT